MPIPALNQHGLLPDGVHDCTLEEIAHSFGWNTRREVLLQQFEQCFEHELGPRFPVPLFFDGSFVTDKDSPSDVDVVADLTRVSDAEKWRGLVFWQDHQVRLKQEYDVDFWIDLPCGNSFSTFFQYLGVKTARSKGLDPRHFKGILRLN